MGQMNFISVKILKTVITVFCSSWPRSKTGGTPKWNGIWILLKSISNLKIIPNIFPCLSILVAHWILLFFPTVMLNLVNTFLDTITFLLPCPSNCLCSWNHLISLHLCKSFPTDLFLLKFQVSIMTAAIVHKQNSPLLITRSSTLI